MKIPKILTELGYVISVEYETKTDSIVFTFPKRGKMKMVLACDGKGKNIFCMRQKLPEKKQASVSDKITSAARRYELWSGFKIDSMRSLRVSEKQLSVAGKITEIVYASDKWDGWHEYVHKFENATRILLDNDDDPVMMQINGSRMRVTERGIDG